MSELELLLDELEQGKTEIEAPESTRNLRLLNESCR